MQVSSIHQGASFSRELAGLRGIAATVVVIFHACLVFRVGTLDEAHNLPFDPSSPWLVFIHVMLAFFNGSAAVILFFVLSGAVLTMSLDRTGGLEAGSLFSFWIRRVFRLLPLLAAVSAIAAVLTRVYFDGRHYDAGTTWMNLYYKGPVSLFQTVNNMVGWSSSLNAPAWTINVELLAAAVFPLLYFFACRGMLLALAGGCILLVPLAMRGGAFFWTMYLFSFYVGCLVPRHGGKLAAVFGAWSVKARGVALFLLIAIAGWIERFSSPQSNLDDPLAVFVMTLCSGALVALALFKALPLPLGTSALLRLGELSYGIYLLHFPIIFVLATALGAQIAGPLSPVAALGLNLFIAFATMAIAYPMAAALHVLIELPGQRIGAALSSRLRSSRSGARKPRAYHSPAE